MQLTIEEACQVLDPPITPRQLRAIVVALGIEPAGKRHVNRTGRPHNTYEHDDILKLHAALLPFLSTCAS